MGSEIQPHADGVGEDLGGPQIVQMPAISDLEHLDVKAFNQLGVDRFNQAFGTDVKPLLTGIPS